MDFFLSSAFIRYELYALFFCLAFALLYASTELFIRLRNLWDTVFPKGRKVHEEVKTVFQKEAPVEVLEEPASLDKPLEPEEENEPTLTLEKRMELADLAKLIRTKIARWELSDARGKIIEGLAIDKWNKELNCLLASLYERDNEYRKAELIYKDLILVHDTDAEIYMKLGFSLSIQGKYEIAYEIYKKLLEISESHIEAAEMLANIAHELGRHEQAVEHAKLFLKSHPRNADILTILSISLIELGNKESALEALEKLKNLDPYNPRVREMKEKLELELELAKKFESATDTVQPESPGETR